MECYMLLFDDERISGTPTTGAGIYRIGMDDGGCNTEIVHGGDVS